ncbi:antitoxin Xre/MbcA/ParS toxin-binding domain-containing protein [Silvibacterium sp.]|uniref:antitoxin Xre/MbcA/ParS toxin-binding domain-containing protein n=1 Tax=Silvibacterium sp. TaxID=1964179 RepID=UPI0039E25973
MAASLALPNVPGYRSEVAADLSDPAVRRRLSPAAVKGFLAIVEKWALKDPEARALLGGISTGSYYSWKKDAKTRSLARSLDQDMLTRISILVGIFKALNILYSRKLADSWITLPNTNPMFRGSTPLAYIIQRGQPGMLHVRQLLDARRGGQ